MWYIHCTSYSRVSCRLPLLDGLNHWIGTEELVSCATVRGLPPIEELGVPPHVRSASGFSRGEPVFLRAPIRRTTGRSGHAGAVVLAALLATAAWITPLRAANPPQSQPMPSMPVAEPSGDGSQ